jgi:Flp pilus assembly protein TadD
LLAIAGSLAILLGVFIAFGDELLALLDQSITSAPAPSPPPLPRKSPMAAQTPQPSAPVAAPANPSPTEPPRTSPAMAAAPPPPPAPLPAGSSPPAAPAPPSPAVVPPPPTDLPRKTAALPSPAAAAPSPAAAKARAVSPEEDLPAILDRIRRQKSKPVTAERVAVVREAGAAELKGPEGEAAIDVSVRIATEREEVKSAYDLMMRGQYDSALILYDKALQNGPPNLAALLGKATAEHKLKHYDEARQTYRRVLALDPDNEAAITNMTAIVATQEPGTALDELRALQRAHPSFSPIPAQMAVLESARGDVAAALSALNTAITLSPDNGLYRLNLAILLDKAGMTEQAAASYEAALNMLGEGGSLPIPLDDVRRRLKYLQGR